MIGEDGSGRQLDQFGRVECGFDYVLAGLLPEEFCLAND